MTRLAISVQGVVQGVGFRPFVYREATSRGLVGWVRNNRGSVDVEVQGPPDKLAGFLFVLRTLAPPPVRVERVDSAEIAEIGDAGFQIVQSDPASPRAPVLPPDLALCATCRSEIADVEQRRYRYPFTNCTQCGPRFSIVTALPYDRERTTMGRFEVCKECESEYNDPANRRYHAEPIACPNCGPKLELLDAQGQLLASGNDALAAFARAILDGHVGALQGLGGFQLIADATNADAVLELRSRKRREEKPLAILFPDLESVRSVAVVSAQEEKLFFAPEAPIVLLKKSPQPSLLLADNIAPNNPFIGAMLPYTALHQLLLWEIARPVVCTSGNISSEPLCINRHEALERLGNVASLFLVNDRPIQRPVDDSVVRVGPKGLEILRRARGYAPAALAVAVDSSRQVLAVGAQLKNTITLGFRNQLLTSQHLGDIESPESEALLARTVDDYLRFFEQSPSVIACDLQRNFASTRLAEKLAETRGAQLVRIQHHEALVAAVAAEHKLSGPVLGLAWDGAGVGHDGSLWGSEALAWDGKYFQRISHLESIALQGGGQAARDPRRSALSLLYATARDKIENFSARWWPHQELELLLGTLSKNMNCPPSTSMGCLFDAVAALLGVRTRERYDGQAAFELECLASRAAFETHAYPVELDNSSVPTLRLEPIVRRVLADMLGGTSKSHIAMRFHNTLVDYGVLAAELVSIPQVVLTGACFQNLRLSRALRARLEERGFQVFVGSQVPPNDGAVSVGQAYLAMSPDAAG